MRQLIQFLIVVQADCLYSYQFKSRPDKHLNKSRITQDQDGTVGFMTQPDAYLCIEYNHIQIVGIYVVIFKPFLLQSHQKSIFRQKKTHILLFHDVLMALMVVNTKNDPWFLNCLKFQQYFPLQQYYQTPEMSDSCQQDASESSQDASRPPSFGRELSKFKPWVFRPKKVVYSLDDCPPIKKLYSTSHWTEEENRKYIQFLMKFREVIEGEKKQRRKWHLNRIMSKFLGTRSHEQCRSHHQKMIKNYRSIDGIIQHFKGNAEPTRTDSDPSTSPTAVYQVEDSLVQLPEESIFNLLANPIDQDSSYIRIPLFYGEESNDMF